MQLMSEKNITYCNTTIGKIKAQFFFEILNNTKRMLGKSQTPCLENTLKHLDTLFSKLSITILMISCDYMFPCHDIHNSTPIVSLVRCDIL